MRDNDQYHYSRETVAGLIPLIWDDEALVLASRAESEIRSRSDPAHGGGLMAMVIDIRKAWASALEREDEDFLVARHVHGITFDAIAELAGLESAHEAADIEECAISAMLNYLNGKR